MPVHISSFDPAFQPGTARGGCTPEAVVSIEIAHHGELTYVFLAIKEPFFFFQDGIQICNFIC